MNFNRDGSGAEGGVSVENVEGVRDRAARSPRLDRKCNVDLSTDTEISETGTAQRRGG